MKILISKYTLFRISFLLFATIVFNLRVNGQAKNDWYYFRDKKTGLIGYKDARGNIKIPAKFSGLTGQLVFRDIIAVYEEKTGESYYLSKNGKKFGIDSLYVWDNSYDDVTEGKIRFRDKKTDKVGFFDKSGKVVIPALYDDARPFHNGLALVTYNGKRKCPDGKNYDGKNPCEEWYWSGKTAIINIHNQIIANNINIDQTENIDWFTLKITDKKPDTTLYNSFKTKNGQYYSFLNHKKEFNKWFFGKYLANLNNSSISNNCFRSIMTQGLFAGQLRKDYSKNHFLSDYKGLLINLMTAIKAIKVETHVFPEDLNSYIYTKKAYPEFYNAEHELDIDKYPVFNVVTTNYTSDRKTMSQNQFAFVRINGSYQLIEVDLKIGLDK